MRAWRAALLAGVVALGSAMPEGSASVGRIERLDPRFDALVAPGAVLEKVADGIEWAEGPLWDAADGSLLLYVAANPWILRLQTRTQGRVAPARGRPSASPLG